MVQSSGDNAMTKHTPANVAVWFEIPVTDMGRAKAFYNAVLQTELRDDNTGPNPMAIFPAAAPKASATRLIL